MTHCLNEKLQHLSNIGGKILTKFSILQELINLQWEKPLFWTTRVALGMGRAKWPFLGEGGMQGVLRTSGQASWAQLVPQSWFCTRTVVPWLPHSLARSWERGSPPGLWGSSLRSSLIEGIVVFYLAKSANNLCFPLSWRESWKSSFFTSF